MKRQKIVLAAVLIAASLSIGIAVAPKVRGQDPAAVARAKADPHTADIMAAEVLEDLFNSKSKPVNVDQYKKSEDDRLQQRIWEENYKQTQPNTFKTLQEDQQKIQTEVDAAVASEAKKAELEKQGFWTKPVMASDQGDQATEKFMEAVGGSKEGGAITSGAKAAVDQMRDDTRDAVRDARQAATDAARQAGAEAARGSTDNCPHGGGGCH